MKLSLELSVVADVTYPLITTFVQAANVTGYGVPYSSLEESGFCLLPVSEKTDEKSAIEEFFSLI